MISKQPWDTALPKIIHSCQRRGLRSHEPGAQSSALGIRIEAPADPCISAGEIRNGVYLCRILGMPYHQEASCQVQFGIIKLIVTCDKLTCKESDKHLGAASW